jgi:hypothetical protein
MPTLDEPLQMIQVGLASVGHMSDGRCQLLHGVDDAVELGGGHVHGRSDAVSDVVLNLTLGHGGDSGWPNAARGTRWSWITLQVDGNPAAQARLLLLLQMLAVPDLP